MATEADHNFVADAQNWEQRVKEELQAQRQWYSDWGTLYAPEAPSNYQEKIKELEERTRPTNCHLGTTNADYGVGAPYVDYKKKKAKKPDII